MSSFEPNRIIVERIKNYDFFNFLLKLDFKLSKCEDSLKNGSYIPHSNQVKNFNNFVGTLRIDFRGL